MSEQYGLSEFSEEIIQDGEYGMDDWDNCVFSNIIKINNYPELEKGVRQTHVGMKHIEENIRKVQDTVQKEYSYSKPRFENGDTLFARITPCLENGKTAFVDILDKGEAATGSTEFLVLSASEEILPKFVYYTARRPDVRQFAIKRMTGSSGRQRVPTDVFDNLTINIPPLDEQRKIVEFLDYLDTKIEVNYDISRNIEQTTNSYFNKIFGESKEHRLINFGEIADLRSGGPRESTDQYTGGPHQWLTPTDATSSETSVINETERGLTDEAFEDTSAEKLPINSVFLTSRATIGEVMINRKPMAMNQGFIGLVPNGEVPPHCLLQFVKNKRKIIESRASGSTYPEISQRSFANIEIEIPSDEYLSIYEDFASTAYDLISSKLSENKTLAATRNEALPKLMTGEIRLTGKDTSSHTSSDKTNES